MPLCCPNAATMTRAAWPVLGLVVALWGRTALADGAGASDGAEGEAEHRSIEDRGIDLVLVGELPFTAVELEAALAVRLGDPLIEKERAGDGGRAPIAAAVVVRALGQAAVVQIGARKREIALGERRGIHAARIVALMIVDLMSPGGAGLPMPEMLARMPNNAAQGTPVAEAGPSPEKAVSTPVAETSAAIANGPARTRADQAPSAYAAPSALAASMASTRGAREAGLAASLDVEAGKQRDPMDGRGFYLAVLPGTILGAGERDMAMIGVAAELSAELRQYRAGVSAGWLHAQEVMESEPVSLDALTLRLSAARRFGALEAVTSVFSAPYWLSSGERGTLFGGGLGLRALLPISEHFHLLGGAGVDYFARRIEFRAAESVLAVTPRLGISVSAGISWNLTN